MEFFYTTQLSVPLYQIGLLLLFSTFSLLFGKIKIALLTNYLFALYWGYILNRELLFGNSLEKLNTFTVIYFSFGCVIAVFALAGFLTHK